MIIYPQYVNGLLIQSGIIEKKQFSKNDKLPNRIEFRFPYERPPLIQIGFTALDDWNGGQLRINSDVIDVGKTYCDILIETWHVSRIWWAQVQWTAMGQLQNGYELSPAELEALQITKELPSEPTEE